MMELVVPKDAKESYDEYTAERAQREIFDCQPAGAASNCDCVLSCIAPFSEDTTREKCIDGKGVCEFRILAATGKADPEGI